MSKAESEAIQFLEYEGLYPDSDIDAQEILPLFVKAIQQAKQRAKDQIIRDREYHRLCSNCEVVTHDLYCKRCFAFAEIKGYKAGYQDGWSCQNTTAENIRKEANGGINE